MIVKKGKRERCESAAVQTGRKLKRTLLCTYFMTLASLVLCCAMFLGTTLAWFSSEVTNAGNVIQVGTLKVEAYHVTTDATGQIVETLVENGDQNPIFEKMAWASGATQIHTLKVVNKGDLNFNYQLSLLLNSNAAAPAGGESAQVDPIAQMQKLLGCFEVYAYNGQTDTVPAEDNIAKDTEDTVGKWVSLGTLEKCLTVKKNDDNSTELVMNELVVFEGTLIPNVTLSEGEPTTGSVQYITVCIKMNDTADTSLMGQSFTINVKLSATQTIAE